jgi:hypothetical protein
MPDPSDQICDLWSTDTLRLHYDILVSIMSIHGTPWLNFKPSQLFEFDEDSDRAFLPNVDPDHNYQTNADPDP